MPDEKKRYFHQHSGKGGARQEDRIGTDIQRIVAQYRKNGTVPTVHLRNPLWGDFTGPTDLQEQIERVELAHDRFMELPADVRKTADNSPVRFLEMFDDPDQRGLLEAAGLRIDDTNTKDPIPEPPSVSDVPSTQPQPPTEEA